MTVNISITSDDVKKSQTISDFVAQALIGGGFNDVTCMHPPPFHAPFKGFNDPGYKPGFTRSRSALETIQDIYPNFLNEPIVLRAIPVMGVDPNYDDTTVDTKPEYQLAYVVPEQYSIHPGHVDTVVLFKTEGQAPPATSSKVPGMEEVVMEAINEQLGNPQVQLDLASTARQMERSGKLKNGYAIAETLDEIEKEKVLANAVEAIADQTGYGSAGLSAETLALIHKDSGIPHEKLVEVFSE
jgi:hypothetical protein